MMQVALKEPTLVVQVEQWARETSRPIEQVLETAVRTYLDELEKEAIHTETETFWAMHDELLKKYRGQHIALYQSKVVDHDESASRLAKRIRERFGQLPVLITLVKPGLRRDLRWIGGRCGVYPVLSPRRVDRKPDLGYNQVCSTSGGS